MFLSAAGGGSTGGTHVTASVGNRQRAAVATGLAVGMAKLWRHLTRLRSWPEAIDTSARKVQLHGFFTERRSNLVAKLQVHPTEHVVEDALGLRQILIARETTGFKAGVAKLPDHVLQGDAVL